MKRQPLAPSSVLVEFWLADGRPAGTGISFALDEGFDLAPSPRPTRLPLRLTLLPRRKRLSPTRRRMS